jgi:diguanylate cyclase (GGDEF)-like protein
MHDAAHATPPGVLMRAVTLARRRLPRLPGDDAYLPLALALAALLLAAGGAVLNERAAAWVLRADAEATGRAWAVALGETLGDELPALLARQEPSPGARAALAQAQRGGEVFRFQLFNGRGELVFVSDDPRYPPSSDVTLASHLGSSEAATRLLDGGVQVHVEHGTAPHRPAYYAEAYVPARQNGTQIGVAEVYVDQAAKQEFHRRAFLIVQLGVAVLVLLAGLLPAFVAWRRTCESRAAKSRAEFLATHDALTGLPNRRRLLEEAARAIGRARRGGSAALLLVDLDRFKRVNDLHGQPAGDCILQDVAQRLRSVTRDGDAVARLGSDEFAVVADLGGDGPEAASHLACRLVAALGPPFALDGAMVQLGCSIGVALAPQDTEIPETMMRRAARALARAKAEGRGCFRFFDADLDACLRARILFETELRGAVARDELVPYFQPVMDLASGRLAGFEMLARWPHPSRGMVPPKEFIAMAEDAGLIASLTEGLLRRACRAAVAWPEGLSVAVNISSLQLRSHALAGMVRAVLEETGLPPHRLEVELTESALIDNFDLAREIVGSLAALGVRLVLDDFGTGYSSLAHLQALRFNKLKIDASFVSAMTRDPDSHKIVAAVVGLGQSLRLQTVAEGVEEQAQADALAGLGCDGGQGWLFGRPVPAEAVPWLIRQATPPNGVLGLA